MRRRDLLIGAGSLATLSVTGFATAEDGDGDAALPADLDPLFDAVPAEDELGRSYVQFVLTSVDGDDRADERPVQARNAIRGLDGIDAGDVDEVLTAVAADYTEQLTIVTGSFERPEPGDRVDAIDGVRVAEDDDRGFVSTDDRAVIVNAGSAEDARSLAITIGETVVGDADSLGDEGGPVVTTVSLLGSKSLVVVLADVDEAGSLDFDGEDLRTFGAAYDADPNTLEGLEKTDAEYALVLEEGVELDDDELRAVLDEFEQGTIEELDVDRDGSVVHVEAVVEQPPERDREAAPEARVRADVDAEAGLVSFEHVDGEPIPADALELWVDGELAASQPAETFDTVEEGDVVEIETDPVASVLLRWTGEDGAVYYDLADALVGRDAFEAEYTLEDDAVEVTYVGERDVDAGKLELRHATEDGVRTPDTAYGGGGTISTGDAVVVEDVTTEETVTLELDVPTPPAHYRQPLLRYHVRPPRAYVYGYRQDELVVQYQDDRERDAAEFEILVDGEAADVQFADEFDVLTDGNSVALDRPTYGSNVTVEWQAPDDPVVVADHVVRPNVNVRVEYDADEGAARLTHAGGEPIDADEVEIRVDDAPTETQPSDERDEFAPEDEIAIDAAPFSSVEVYWVGHDRVEHRLGGRLIGREAIQARYDADAKEVELVYTGERDADPEPLEVEHSGGNRAASDDATPLFAETYDTLTTGDGVVLEGVEPTDHVVIWLVEEGENYSSRRSILTFSPEPRWAFRFEEDAGEVTAVYTDTIERNADKFEFRVDGAPAAVQPADEHDTLSPDDELDLGSIDAGSVITVEWVVPDEPIQVADHVVLPDAEFDVRYDAEEETATIEHAGGDQVAASDLGVVVEPSGDEPTPWGDDGTVSKGETLTVEAGEKDRIVAVVYRGREPLVIEELHG